MGEIPDKFQEIRENAEHTWEVLADNPNVMGVWNLLFNQVKSPEHVISELLQNADDAGASWAAITLKGDKFIFAHNGADFSSENFEAICSFGISQKKTLHTIGFRGIGFKSVFSLGPKVEVRTPSIAFAFEEPRFTVPIWLTHNKKLQFTSFTVHIQNPELKQLIQNQLTRWMNSPVPLLFFRNIQKLQIDDLEILCQRDEKGPILNSEWVVLRGIREDKVMVITSELEEFPAECIQEIRAERQIGQDIEIPPCQVELVLGLPDQYAYVVLPAQGEIPLPFSINGPFIQDPSRQQIKHPGNSPTNRWLLDRAGVLAANAMLQWLAASGLTLEERAQAYCLLSTSSEDKQGYKSVAHECASVVIRAMKRVLSDQPVLLSSAGKLVLKNGCTDIPGEFCAVWSLDQLQQIYPDSNGRFLAPQIGREHRLLLEEWKFISLRNIPTVLDGLAKFDKLPRPKTLAQIRLLWLFLEKAFPKWESQYYLSRKASKLAVIPTKGRDVLLRAANLCILSQGEKSFWAEEWGLFEDYIDVIDPKWEKYLDSNKTAEYAQSLRGVAQYLGLNSGQATKAILNNIINSIFSQKENKSARLQIAWIAARFKIPLPDNFRFLCRDGHWHPVTQNLMADITGNLTEFLPENWILEHTLSDEYEAQIPHKYRQDWNIWIKSPESRLQFFLRPNSTPEWIYGKGKLDQFCAQRGIPAITTTYKSEQFINYDFDFVPELWEYWETLAKRRKNFWFSLVKLIASDWGPAWEQLSHASVWQSTVKYNHRLEHKPIMASWLVRLQGLPCLQDTHGKAALPSNLYRVTAETQALQGLEPFVVPSFDKPKNADLLDCLGVNRTPLNADKLLNRLKILAAVTVLKPTLIQELVKIYAAIDQLFPSMPKPEKDKCRAAFTHERLILAEGGGWFACKSIHQQNADDIPGATVIIHDAAQLMLWDRLEVPKNPTIETALDWLRNLEPALDHADRRRVEALLKRWPHVIWRTTGCWLNWAGQWVPCEKLHWWSTNKPTPGWFSHITEIIADFSMVGGDLEFMSDIRLVQMETILEHRLSQKIEAEDLAPLPEWIGVLAQMLYCVELSNPAAAQTIQEAAERLYRSKGKKANTITSTPYLDGTQAGPARLEKVIWQGNMLLYAETAETAPREWALALAAYFPDDALKKAIGECVDRSPGYIQNFFRRYYTLDMSRLAALEAARVMVEAKPADTPAPVEKKIKLNLEAVTEAEKTKEELGSGSDGKPMSDVDIDLLVNVRRTKPSAKTKAALYFRQLGYVQQEAEDHFKNDGRLIVKVEGFFPYEERNRQGEVIGRYRLVEGSLETGFEIQASVWNLMQTDPGCRLVLIDERGEALTISSQDLQENVNNGSIALYPSEYHVQFNRQAQAPTEAGIDFSG